MVKLHTPQMMGYGQDAKPVMPRHRLTATKDTRTFKKDESDECFITHMSDGRYAVFSAIFAGPTKHMEVFTESELHESFIETNLE